LIIKGLLEDESETTYDLLNIDPLPNHWTNGTARTWGLTYQEPVRGFRVYVKSYDRNQGGTNHTGWSDLVVKYMEPAYDRN
jgi:hypothetical protein